jgi:UDP-3-O-[3-hydroxymyristoyl] N-acetylglucosamine deacetylase
MNEAIEVDTTPRERTIRHAIGCVGVGLHSGARVALTLRPAEPGSGIRFRRADRPGTPMLPARHDLVVATTMSTTLGISNGPRVGTVEHLMAAFAACGIDNLVVELSGPEVPAMDGSAQPFIFLIECAGIVEQETPRRVIEVLKPVTVTAEGAWARLEPAPAPALNCRIEFAHPAIGSQSLDLVFTPEGFKSAIAPARTFGFAETLDELRARGLARGGTLRNAVVLDATRVLNPEGLRFNDEFVRHKLLDAVGDLYLAGAPLKARYVGHCAGHTLNNRLLHHLFADRSAWHSPNDDGRPQQPPLVERAHALAGA